MTDEASPFIPFVDNLTGKCPVCGFKMMSVPKMQSWICTNCDWQKDEAVRVAQGELPWRVKAEESRMKREQKK